MVTEVEEAIVAHLVRQPGVRSASRPGPSGWVASTGGQGSPGADPDSIAFQKTRQLPTCQMHQVAFTNFREIPVELVIRTCLEPDGTWIVAPTGGGSPGPSRRQEPWVNFTAGFGAEGFSAAESVKRFETLSYDAFSATSSAGSGSLIQAMGGRLGGSGLRCRNLAGLAA